MSASAKKDKLMLNAKTKDCFITHEADSCNDKSIALLVNLGGMGF
jgi:hypothetical protein